MSRLEGDGWVEGWSLGGGLVEECWHELWRLLGFVELKIHLLGVDCDVLL